VPDVRVERLLDASHWVQQDSPHKVNALLLEFLRAPGRRDGTGDADLSTNDLDPGLIGDGPSAE
jgi:hypothetical protein